MKISTYQQKLNTVQFKGYTSNFSKKLDALLEGNLKSHKNVESEFKKILKCKIKPSNLIGEGFHELVYKIDDKYVLKFSKRNFDTLTNTLTKVVKRKFKNLKSYFGEPVVVFGDIKILPNVSNGGKHVPAGIPFIYSRKHTSWENEEYYIKKYLPLFAELPQQSFDRIAKDLALLNKKKSKSGYYVFDYKNPNNFVLTGKTIKIVDVTTNTSIRNSNCAADLLNVFLENMEIDTISRYNPEAVVNRRKLFKKVVLAAAKNDLPMAASSSDEILIEKVFKDLCNGDGECKSVLKEIKSIVKNNPNIKKRAELLNIYIDNLFENI